MRSFRARASMLGVFVLIWQIAGVIFMPAAARCNAQAAPVDMANCPMHHSTADAECPMHAKVAVDHDCHCPVLRCSATHEGFLALLGPIGVLPPTSPFPVIDQAVGAVFVAVSSSISFAPNPVAPPPRA